MTLSELGKMANSEENKGLIKQSVMSDNARCALGMVKGEIQLAFYHPCEQLCRLAQ